MKPVNLTPQLATAEIELACLKIALTQVKEDHDELRQERDDWRGEAEICAERLIAAKLREADERHVAPPGVSPMVASPRGRLDPNAWPSAPDLEPSEGEQDERYDERTDCVLASDVSGARLEPREKRGKATHWNQPVHGGDGKEQDAKKSRDQRQGSVHKAALRTVPPLS